MPFRQIFLVLPIGFLLCLSCEVKSSETIARTTPSPAPTREPVLSAPECLSQIPAGVVKYAAYTYTIRPLIAWNKNGQKRQEILVLPFTIPEQTLTSNYLVALKASAAKCKPGEVVPLKRSQGSIDVEIPKSDETVVFTALDNLCLLSIWSWQKRASEDRTLSDHLVMAFSNPYVARYEAEEPPKVIKYGLDKFPGPKRGVAVSVYQYGGAWIGWNQENFWLPVLPFEDGCAALGPMKVKEMVQLVF